MNFDLLDANTKKVYLGKPCSDTYDSSVFVEATASKTPMGQALTLYVPCAKRMRWFKADYPEGRVITDTPLFNGNNHWVTVVARAYKTTKDFVDGIPAAVNSCTREINPKYDNTYLVDSAVTRAMSRVLRDIGYDLPYDAHVIDGWTPIHKMNQGVNLPDEAVESSQVIFVPIIKNDEDVPQEQAMQETSPVDEKQKRVPINTEDVMVEDMPQGQVQMPENQNSLVDASAGEDVRFEKKTAPTQNQDDSEALKQEKMAVTYQNEPEKAPKAVNTENDEPLNYDELLAEAQKEFLNPAAAAEYTCKQLGTRTVGDQGDKRVVYFVKKAREGKLLDKKLGYACALVAKERGIREVYQA